MRTELEQKLAEEFPFMNRDPAALKEQPALDLYGAFGCDFGDGWYSLLRDMCVEIAQVYADLGMEVGFTPTQIKEKYGSLRVYYNTNVSTGGKIQEIVEKYEALSESVCELCGEPGTLRNDLSWWRTLCEEHYLWVKNAKPEDYTFYNLLKALEELEQGDD